ncbi:alpha-hydroxy-acid oxidizing protein [Nocardioides agariphilus]|uniref:Alpha-hydroxy-acid oxidizing protein n=1 Tax=Nocardioides agariphilus TaxID=433664 RepID=A0A930YMH4_9ACTN|nr:alpha-hydroxy acid oxidase [Nocardioides agariphilus]MBF4768119.1 alpha-hydroxy-acid oxidizing protein [Nocardioides agariphilus]
MSSPLDREPDARGVLPPDIHDYVATGAGDEETVAANRDAWGRWWLRPRVLTGVSDVDLTTTMLGTTVSSPVLVAPTGYQRQVHREGEVGTARAAAEAGALFVLSTRASCRLDDVAAVAGPWWLQVYVLRDRGITEEVVRRSVAAGARALVLTGDTPVVSTRSRRSSFDPAHAATMARDLTDVRDDSAYEQAPDVTYADIGWLREVSGGLPVVVKGVLRADDARACVAAGAAAVWVSNHGGRQLDGVVPTAVALPEVADAVGSDAEVFVDGGVRHGRDVVRALALGARGVGLGRAVLWALAADGSAGVADLLAAYEANLTETMQLVGARSPSGVTRDLVTWR